jgi:hypothetical protein
MAMGGPLASPDTFAGGQSPDVNTLMASPLADRLGGGVTNERYQQIAMLVPMLRQGLKMLSTLLLDLDPRQAAELEAMAAKLLKIEVPPMPLPAQLPTAAQMGGAMNPNPLPTPMGMGPGIIGG